MMPNRMIRDGLLDSERYWSVTIEARQMFTHLMLLADDFGCVSLAPLFLRRRCFNDSPSTEKIGRLVTELSDADLIRCYDSDLACFAFIPRFGQRLQRDTLKHPMPPESLFKDDEAATKKFNKIIQETTNSTVGKPLRTVGQPPEVKRSEEKRTTPVVPVSFEKFWSAYPRKKSRGAAERAWSKLSPNEQLVAEILQAIERAKTSDSWREDRYIPHPATWLNAKGWLDEIPEVAERGVAL